MMRKYLIASLLILSGSALAADFSADGLNYEICSSATGECILVGVVGDMDYTGKSIVIPSHVTFGEEEFDVSAIGPEAFSGLDISSIEVPSSVREIGAWAFYLCRRLREVKLEEGLLSIGDFCFQDNSALLEIDIPSTVEDVGKGSFRGCMSLRSVSLPPSIDYLPEYTFMDCGKLVDIDTQGIISEVGAFCFDNCASLGYFDFSTLDRIGERAFSGCKSLQEVILKSDLSVVPEGSFEHCESLRTVVTGPRVLKMEDFCFAGCTLLRQLEIGISVETIGSDAFANCNSLRDIYVVNDASPAINVTTFPSSAYLMATLYVGTGAENRFAQSPYWMNFRNIVGVDIFPLTVMELKQSGGMKAVVRGDALEVCGSGKLSVVDAAGLVVFSGDVAGWLNLDISGFSRPLIVSDGRDSLKLF